ncbi:acid protease [Mytilinidion resinicola]|uniref:Acid protease n=1 Tax=Mytilinidion resinicola TaxID=574789 RepID=A0A6A6YCT7_9PEZI|nr:acid protease [Mytilinidion resinicola]KAF2805657.1 acid protease [Mytilinidion resinicola]
MAMSLLPWAEAHISLPLTKLLNYGKSGYTVNLTIGTPPQTVMATMDTGSSDTFLSNYESPWGFFNPNLSTTYKPLTSLDPYVSRYRQGAQNGTYFADTISLGATTEANLTMALIPPPGMGGPPYNLLGLDFDEGEMKAQLAEIAANYTIPDSDLPIYPNFVTTLKNQGSIRKCAYSIYLNMLNAGFGELLFGAIDTARFVDPLKYVNLARSPVTGLNDVMMVPWAGLAMRTEKGTVQLPLPPKSNATFDSGTTISYLPLAAARQIAVEAGAVERNLSGAIHYYLPCDAATNFSLSYTFGDEKTTCASGGPRIEVPASELVLPVSANSGTDVPDLPKFGGFETCELGIMGEETYTPNFGYLLGDTFMRSAYLVYDLEEKKIGIAQAKLNVTETEIVELC